MTAGFPWKGSRCIHCGTKSFDTDRDLNPVCIQHLDYQVYFRRELTKIGELIGKSAKDKWLDENWPGDDGVIVIIDKDGFEKATAYYRTIRAELSAACKDICTCRSGRGLFHTEPCKACIKQAHIFYPEPEDMIKQFDR